MLSESDISNSNQQSKLRKGMAAIKMKYPLCYHNHNRPSFASIKKNSTNVNWIIIYLSKKSEKFQSICIFYLFSKDERGMYIIKKLNWNQS